MATDGVVLTIVRAQELIRGPGNQGTVAQSPEYISRAIAAAESSVAAVVGPLAPAAVTRDVLWGRTGHVLPTGPYVGPVSAAVSLPDGTAWSGVLANLKEAHGVLYGLPRGDWRITYTAGWVTLPGDLANAVDEMFLHLWEQRRAGRNPQPGSAHSMPWRVEEVLDRYRWGGGFA